MTTPIVKCATCVRNKKAKPFVALIKFLDQPGLKLRLRRGWVSEAAVKLPECSVCEEDLNTTARAFYHGCGQIRCYKCKEAGTECYAERQDDALQNQPHVPQELNNNSQETDPDVKGIQDESGNESGDEYSDAQPIIKSADNDTTSPHNDNSLSVDGGDLCGADDPRWYRCDVLTQFFETYFMGVGARQEENDARAREKKGFLKVCETCDAEEPVDNMLYCNECKQTICGVCCHDAHSHHDAVKLFKSELKKLVWARNKDLDDELSHLPEEAERLHTGFEAALRKFMAAGRKRARQLQAMDRFVPAKRSSNIIEKFVDEAVQIWKRHKECTEEFTDIMKKRTRELDPEDRPTTSRASQRH
ncbi:unnamed protein product, partial [Mesorhabditis spiculigera]